MGAESRQVEAAASEDHQEGLGGLARVSTNKERH